MTSRVGGSYSWSRPFELEDFEQPCGTLTATDAHRYHAPLGLAALALEEQVSDAACARHAEGVAD